MRYFVEIGGDESPREVVLEDGPDGLVARLDGKEVRVDLAASGGACYSLLLGTEAFDLVAETGRDGRVDLSLSGRRFVARVERESERDARALGRSGAAPGGPVVSAMPGIVARILKPEGDAVRRGETVLIVEAMKMENEVKAEHDGVVASLAVKVGDRIQNGDRLFELSRPASVRLGGDES